jgi:hypothetical protein
MTDIDKIELEFVDRECEEELSRHLEGQIFHLTKRTSFEKIEKASFIRHNKNGSFGLNTSSQGSYGRNKGYVCLFDLRNSDINNIGNILDCYNFYHPEWVIKYDVDDKEEYNERNFAYLIVNPTYYDKLIPNDEARSLNGFFIPKVECWFPGDMPIKYINKVIFSRIRSSEPMPIQAL